MPARTFVPALLRSVAAGFSWAPATAAAQTTLNKHLAHPEFALWRGGRHVRAQGRKRTKGRYKVQNFYTGALGAERESVEALQLGTLDLTSTSTGPVPDFVPEVAVLDIPFLFRDHAHARAVLDGPIGQEMAAAVFS
jgi:TRAP-type C4-dicarboxylate transport system substrate-binding protein